MAISGEPIGGSEQCPECGGVVRPDGTEQVCGSCGLVVDGHEIDHGPEWRGFNADAKKRAEPTNPDRQGKELGSEIGFGAGANPALERQRREHTRAKAQNKRERNLRYVIGEINRVASALELPRTLAKQAANSFREVYESRDDVHGHDLDELAATAAYTTCRDNQRGLVPEDVAEVARSGSAKDIARRHKWFCSELGIVPPPPCPRQRLRVVASRMDLPRDAVDRALSRLDAVDDVEHSRGAPSTLVAAVLYDAVDETTQASVADAAGCTPASVRNRWKDIRLEGQTTVDMFG